MASELKPCPFCGSDRIFPVPANRNSKERLYPIVRCMGCYTDVPGKNDDFSIDCKTAVAAWNRRAPSPSPAPGVVTDDGLDQFTAYFVKNYPGPETIIHDPKWHAPRIFRAAKAASLSQPAKDEREGGGA